eukprot:CAMPEP_0181416310 /NCGR_PEP_ID=MMETSP1110-20121109/10456_1 /TAXON_ID=174948 /ORGANISM="Symbiodinium sp., Strain CCMP421" /LENGTH=82 /DNA_ID=CAMNT_0023539219 /DNA_START=284 /DNA_END=529 /DNA_ORIENTATION=-
MNEGEDTEEVRDDVLPPLVTVLLRALHLLPECLEHHSGLHFFQVTLEEDAPQEGETGHEARSAQLPQLLAHRLGHGLRFDHL